MKNQGKQKIHVQNQHRSEFSTESKRFIQKTSEITTSQNNFTILSKINEGLQNISENHKRLQKNNKRSQNTRRHHDFVHPDRTTTGPRQDHDRTTTAKSGPRQDHDRTTTGPRQVFQARSCFFVWSAMVADPLWLFLAIIIEFDQFCMIPVFFYVKYGFLMIICVFHSGSLKHDRNSWKYARIIEDHIEYEKMLQNLTKAT